jgi:rhodanese-related sulfurtransferase
VTPDWVVAAGLVAAALVAKRLLVGPRAPKQVLAERIAAGATIVDVRTRGEFDGGAYPGAVNIPLGELQGRLGEIPKDRPVVLYCASGARSGSAARALRRAGYGEVLNAGGIRRLPW